MPSVPVPLSVPRRRESIAFSPPDRNVSPGPLGALAARLLAVLEQPYDVVRQALSPGSLEVTTVEDLVREEHRRHDGRIEDPGGHRPGSGHPPGICPPVEGGPPA